MKPLVSIGMPVYNGGEHLALALESLLNQSYDHFELIICDNASTDMTETICREFKARDGRISYFKNISNLGLIRNFNRVFSFAKGEYFMWAGSDDLWASSYLEKCMERLIGHPTAAMCRTQLVEIDRHGIYLMDTTQLTFWERAQHILYRWFLYGVYQVAFLKRTRLLTETFAADHVLELEILLMGDILLVDEALMYYRIPNQQKQLSEYINEYNIDETLKQKLISAPWSSLYMEFNAVINRSHLDKGIQQQLKNLFYSTIVNDNILVQRLLIGNESLQSSREIEGFVKLIFS